MKTKIYLLLFSNIFVFSVALAQNRNLEMRADTPFFNYAFWNGLADKMRLKPAERAEMLNGQKKHVYDEFYGRHEHVRDSDIVWIQNPAPPSPSKGYSQNNTNALQCTNIDFETGTFAGWTRWTGFNPGIPGIGCCPNPNGDQTIMSGGTDTYGGFPRVFPGSGSFSLRLGSTAIGGIADRIEQKFYVTPANANFTYRYAVVLNDGGHDPADQPKFVSQIVDTLGQPIPCTFYEVSAGSGVTGYSTSALTANNGPVIYKNWTNVAVDLTPNIGQNVILRFTVMDCRPTGHFAYAYVDGLCTSFETSVADTTCPNVPFTMCAPPGFSVYTWNGPGVINDPNRCINVTIPGVYTCTTLLVPGCPGPTFQHTLTTLPPPIVSFTPVTTGPCVRQYTFNQTMSISGGSITSHTWDFGDGATSTALNPVHNYAGPGNYAVKLRAKSNRGCLDSVVNFITVFPTPNLSFSPPSNCINTVVQFSNTSSIAVGSITGYTWTLGNGANSNLVNPTNSYTTNGTYTITLDAESNQGCTSSLTQTLGIFPPPIISFSADPLCDINGTSFSPATSTAIVSGNLAYYNWTFGDGGTSTQANPVHVYTSPGVYVVNLTATSNHNCTASTSNTLTISPTPTVAFATTSINACSPNFTFTNLSGISAGPITYTWNFGGGNTTTVNSPTYVFPSIGDYTVSLIGESNMGCKDTLVQYISVYPYPIINVSVPASCENAIFTVSTTALMGSVTSYSWNFGDPLSGAANTSTLQNPTHYFSTTNIYTLNLDIISNLNCASHYSTTMTVYPNPKSIFTYSTANNCSLPFIYTNSSSVTPIGGSTMSNYKWDFGPAGTSTLANPGVVNFPGNGNYTVSLIAITNHNCSDTTSANILVHPAPVVDFTVVPTCLTKPMVTTTSSSISPNPVPTSSISSYLFNYGDGFFTNSVTPAPHSYSASNTYTLTYSATSNMGCTSAVSKTVSILATPALNFTTTSNMCLGNATQFTSTSSIPSGTIFALNWSFGDGSPPGANANTAHTYTAAGTYTVKFYGITDKECTDTVRKPVTVHPLPTVNFTVLNVCVNTLINFDIGTSTVTPGALSSYQWDFGDGQSSTIQNATHTYSNYGVYSPSLTVFSDKGCPNYTTNLITIFPQPNLSFSPPGACVNSPIQFTNTSFIPIGTINNYIWNFADGSPTVNVTQPQHTFTTPAVYVVTMTATSDQGCARTATNSLNIYPYPSVSITPINSSCVNDQVTIYPNVSITGNNNPINGYTVSYGDGSPAFTSTSALQYILTHTYTAYNTYTVSLSATSNGCATNTTTILKVYPKPFTNFVASNFCYNNVTQFVNTSSIAATYSIDAHTWNFNDGATPQSTLQNASHIFSGPGQYNISLTEFTFPEAGLTCSTSAVKTITINPIPTLSFISNSVCAGVATSFTNTSQPVSPTQTVTGWSWYFHNNGQLNSSTQSPSFTYSASGAYNASLSAVNNFGCSSGTLNPVTVWANPNVSFTVANGCLGAASNFTESTTINDPATNSLNSWAWKYGDGSPQNNSQNPSYNYPSYGTFHPTLTVTSNRGCVSSLTHSVTIHPTPIVSFSPPGACVGTAIQFTNNSTIPLGSISSYVWNFGDGNPTVSVVNPTYNYPVANTYTVSLTGTSNQGCATTFTNGLKISPYPQIQPLALGSKCVNDVILITPVVSITGVNNAISGYTVGFGDGSPALVTPFPAQYSVSHTYTSNTSSNIYTISLSAVSNGCQTNAATTISVYPKPFTNFVASNFCERGSTSFVNTSTIAPSGTINAFFWDFNDGAAASSTVTSPSYSFLSVGVKNVSLTAFSYPEPALTCSAIVVKSLTINPIPVLTSFNTNSVCQGNPTQFTNNSPTVGVNGWTWITNGAPFSNAANPSFIYPGNGKFVTKLIALNAFGCRDTISDTVRVYANPTASFVTNNECFGKQSVFSNQSVKGDGSLTTYTWSTNNNFGFSFDQNGLFTYPAPGTYTVQLIQGSSLGCIGKFTNTVTVYPLANVNFSANEVCQNQPTSFTNLSTISSGSISSFQWTFNDPSSGTNSVSALVHPTHQFPQAGSYAATLEATSNFNCKSPAKIVNVIVHGVPFANFTNTTVCAGNALSFVNLSTSTDGSITSNAWDFNGDNITDQNTMSPGYSYSLHGSYLTSLIVTTQFGCWDSIVKPIYANPKPVVSINSDARAGCPPMLVNFTNASSIANGTYTSTWDFGDGSPTSTLQSTAHTYGTGSYDLELTLVSDKGCRTIYRHPGYVTVSPPPVAGFYVEPEQVDEEEPIITVKNEASGDVNSVRYYISDGATYSGNNFTHYIKNLKTTKPMVVQIVKNEHGCADTLYRVIDIKPAYVIYFPDVFTPNGDGINDDFRPKGVGILRFNLNIYDRWGHQVFQTNDMTETWDGTTRNRDDQVKQDVYTWKAQVTDIFNKNHFLVGRVTVIR